MTAVANTQLNFIAAACRDPGTFDVSGRGLNDTLELRSTLTDQIERNLVAFLQALADEAREHSHVFNHDAAQDAINSISDAFGDLTGVFLKAADAAEMEAA